MSDGLLYDSSFFANAKGGAFHSAAVIVPRILEIVPAKSVIDVGCGSGVWLRTFLHHGVEEIRGYDGDYVDRALLEIPKEAFVPVDLTQPFPSPDRSFELALSLEVGEHIPEERAEGFVANICSLAPIVVFSAACPFQGGTGHLNERWPSYWAELFARCDYRVVDCLRPLIWQETESQTFYIQNVLIYAKEEAIESNPRLKEGYLCTQPNRLDMIHPRFFEWVSNARLYEGNPEYMSVRTAWINLRGTISNGILRRLGRKKYIE